MSALNDHFRRSGYSPHRQSLRWERLPDCCRGGLTDCGASVKYLGLSGENVLLPLVKCAVCGRYYAVCGKKYMLIENLLRYETVTNR